jgi:hypothetical protein
MTGYRHRPRSVGRDPHVVLGSVSEHRRAVATEVGFQVSPADHAFLAFFGGHRRV